MGENMNTRTSLIVFLLVALASYAWADNRFVYLIEDDNYESLFQRHPNLITYYSPKKVDSDTEEFLKDLSQISSTGAVNCKDQPDPCLDHGVSVRDCPQIAITTGMSRVVYKGDLNDRDAIREWAKDRILGAVVPIKSIDSTEQFNSGTWLIKFFAPWCGHCKTLAPVWTSLSKKIGDDIHVAKVDCTTGGLQEYCTEHGVEGFPTIQLWKDGELAGTYEGDRSETSIIEWAQGLANGEPAH